MPRMRRNLTAVPLAAVAVLLVTACTGGSGDDADLPAGQPLLASAADEMAGVETVGIRMEADTSMADLAMYRAVDGVLTRAGDAQGTVELEQAGQLVEVEFVAVDDTFYYRLFGGWSEMPLAEAGTLYDPSTILDPDRGLAHLLRTATDPEVRGEEGGRYEVAATFTGEAVSALLPAAVPGDVQGTVWIGTDRPLLHRGEFPLPGEEAETGTVIVELSDFDAPAQISAP